MKRKFVHEPSAKLMSAADSIADANRLKELFTERALRSAPAVEVRIPLASFLAALDQFPRKDLLEVKQNLLQIGCHSDLERTRSMPAISLKAHFDGQKIQLDEPFEIPPDAQLLVTVLKPPLAEEERQTWLALSARSLAAAYGDNEPDYSDVEILP